MAVFTDPVREERQRPEKDWIDTLGSILEVGGAVAGGIMGSAGGPAGIAGGASMGMGLGRALGGLVSPFADGRGDIRRGFSEAARGMALGGKAIQSAWDKEAKEAQIANLYGRRVSPLRQRVDVGPSPFATVSQQNLDNGYSSMLPSDHFLSPNRTYAPLD